MEEDKELSAMAAVNAAVTGLEPEVVARVLRWAMDRHKVPLLGPVAPKQDVGKDPASNDRPGPGQKNQEYEHFSDFYDAADPTTEADRVLVAGYWFQVLRSEGELESQRLNKELKNTGHGVTHMPHAVDDLMKAKPRLMIQLKKSGTTQQARRKFKLTTEGVKRVCAMLKSDAE